MEKKKRILLYLLGGLLCAVVLVGIYELLTESTVSYDGKLIAEVGSGVEILRDAQGYPLIRASSWDDAYHAMGYLHAQDRFLLIEYIRAAARGRLAELTGREALPMDRISRIIGFSNRADELMPRLSAVHNGYLNAYAKGINLFKRKKLKDIVHRYDIARDDWKAADVVAVILLREWIHGYLSNKELLFPMPVELNSYQVKDVIPDDLVYFYSTAEQKNVFMLKEIRKIVKEFFGEELSGFAGYVPGNRTADGKPRMFFNLDASMDLYPSWYPLGLQIGDERIDGLTSAGMPFILAGKNNSIAFAGFAAKMDSQDFYLEDVRQGEGEERYFSQGVWKSFDRRIERILSGKKRRENVTELTVRVTDRGPVISDVFTGIFKTDVVSFRYIPPDETLILSLFELPRAKSIQHAQQAAGRINSQPRVFLVSAQERTLLFYTGKVPVRAFPDRIFKKDAGWPTVMDLPANPQFTADDTLITGNDIYETEPALIKNYMQFNDKGRAARLRDLLESTPVLDESRIESILFDTYSATAARYIPVIMPVLQKIPVTSARLSRMYFNDWDFHMTRESVPAMVFQTLLMELMRETMADEFKNEMDDLISGHYFLAEKLYDTFSADKSLIFDDVTTKDKVEFRDMIFDRAFLKAMRFLNSRRGPIMETWTWGSLHQGRFTIPLVKGSFITRRQYKSEDVPVSGGFSTLHKGSYDARQGFRASGVTACSGIISAEKVLISASFGCSMNPDSEYFSQYRESRRFVPLGMSAPDRVMVLAPKK